MYISKILFFIAIVSLTLLNANSDFSQAKKLKQIYPMGKKIYLKKCSKIDVSNFKSYDILKSEIVKQRLCEPLDNRYLEALSIYLWEVKKAEQTKIPEQKIEIKKDEKCPVCGMFVYKYPKWASQIFYKDHHLSFDGVKDMMKYFFKHNSNISKILVTDYYSQKVIDAFEAYFVVGSDVPGPMGDELIPFKSESEAKAFSMDHKGIKVLKFKDIKREEVYK